MKQKIRWGILSTAKIATEKVIPAIQQGEYSEVVAICSRDITKAQEVAGNLNIGKYYGSYEELLQDPDIDAVYNPLPNHMHVPWTIKALEAGKHVLCEKPIGLNTEDARKLVDETLKYPHLKVMEAFMYRFHPQWHQVLSLIRNGVIGEVRSVHTIFSYYNDDPANIRNQMGIGGGALMDIGCYCISFPRFIYGEEPEAVTGLMDTDPQMHTDRLTSGLMKFSSGKSASFTCSTQLFSFQRTVISGTNGQINIKIPVNAPPAGTTTIELINNDGVKEFSFTPVDQYTLEADAFSLAILEDKPVPTPLDDAIGNMKVIDAIIESVKENRWINIS
ncbi:Gfo/Idh/MocA family protein [Parabacteroides sp. FAFU027]|uniref:Gfo/Idh/MocA family protein n=1 Tax=Parabacteroides sp. FAFU027 TaxID=2922715 RepID=UPI001FAF2C72|nr:Gfo/Idh/MocA family oxidoreductase [Parabacteroides sp. FAFU027]